MEIDEPLNSVTAAAAAISYTTHSFIDAHRYKFVPLAVSALTVPVSRRNAISFRSVASYYKTELLLLIRLRVNNFSPFYAMSVQYDPINR